MRVALLCQRPRSIPQVLQRDSFPLIYASVVTQAAEARKQEGLSSSRDAEFPPPSNGRQTRGSVHAGRARPAARQSSNGPGRPGPAPCSSGEKSETATALKTQALSVSTPEPAGPAVANTERNIGSTTAESRETVTPGPRDVSPSPRAPAPPASDVVAPSRETANCDADDTPRDGGTGSGGGGGARGDDESGGNGSLGDGGSDPVDANRAQSAAMNSRGAGGGGHGGVGEDVAQHRRRGRDGGAARSLPPGAEVLEVMCL